MKKRFLFLPVFMLFILCSCHAVRQPDGEAIGHGVSYTALSRPEAPWEIRVIRVARDADASIDMVIARDTLPGRERVSEAVERIEKQNRKVIAGVNGDFYYMGNHEKEGLPLGPSVSFGRLFTSGRTTGAFFIAADGIPRTGTLTFQGMIENDGRKIPFEVFNWEGSNSKDKKYVAPDQKQGSKILVFSDLWGWKIPFRGVRVKMKDASFGTAGSYEGEVTGPFSAWETVDQSPGNLVIAGLGDKEEIVNALKGKVRISFGFREIGQKLKMAIGSWQILLKNGKIAVSPGGPRHPRTMIGFNDREILLVTVDGRQKGWSRGMTSYEEAELLQDLGCNEGCNIDGGGSTTAWVLGKCVNRPSDLSGMRPNANCILVTE